MPSLKIRNDCYSIQKVVCYHGKSERISLQANTAIILNDITTRKELMFTTLSFRARAAHR